MSQFVVVQSKFSKSSVVQLTKRLEFINFNQSKSAISNIKIQAVSPKNYLWAIGTNPAYFIQYQIDSVAILKINGNILIVWKPKYIEYPSMIQFPQLLDKKLNGFNIIIDPSSTTNQQTNLLVQDFIQKFYASYFYEDKQFETNLVTFSKHFLTKTVAFSYWHALLEDTGNIFVTQEGHMTSKLRVRITGPKDYNKTLFLFSFKGQRDGMISMAKQKWMQLVSFLGMMLIFYSVVGCDSNANQGICVYKEQMTLTGAGLMLGLLAVRYANKKNKKKRTEINTQKKRN